MAKSKSSGAQKSRKEATKNPAAKPGLSGKERKNKAPPFGKKEKK